MHAILAKPVRANKIHRLCRRPQRGMLAAMFSSGVRMVGGCRLVCLAVGLAGTAVIVTVALALRLYGIGEQELWFDEAFSFHLATITSGLGDALRLENSPPLYYLLLRSWVSLAGTSEAAVRLLSAIFSTLFVLAILWAGKALFNRQVALWSGLFATVAPLQIYYAQEARCYALAALAVLTAYVLLWRALERHRMAAWAAFCLAALAALYTHYFTLIALAPTLVLVWAHAGGSREGTSEGTSEGTRSKRAWLGYGLAALACAILYVPWLLWCFVLMAHPFDFAGWMEEAWAFTPPALAIPKSLEVQGLGSQAGFYPPFAKIFPALRFPTGLRLLGLAALVSLGLCAALRWGDETLGVPRLKRLKAWLWTLLLFPLAAIWLLSLVKPAYVVGRHDMLISPAFVLLVGLGLAKLQAAGKNGGAGSSGGAHRVSRLLLPAAVLALFVPIGVKLALYYQAAASRARSHEEQTAATLDTVVNNGDVVVLSGQRSLEALYYLHRRGYRWEAGRCSDGTRGREFGCRLLPPTYERGLGYEPPRNGPVSGSATEVAQGLLSALRGPDAALWVVLDATAFAHSRTQAPEFFSALSDELSQRGYELGETAVEGPPGILQFRRANSPGQSGGERKSG